MIWVNKMNYKSLHIFLKNIFSGLSFPRIFCLFLVTILFFFFPLVKVAVGSEASSFAVYYFNNQTKNSDWQWLERGLPDMLDHTFSQFDQLQYISLPKIDELLDTDEFSGLSENKDLSLFRNLDNLLKVDLIFTGNYTLDQQGNIRLDLMMYQSQIDELLEFREMTVSPESLFQLKEDIARVILRESGIVIDEELAMYLKDNVTTSPIALQYYYQAIELKNQAIREYQGIDFPSKPLWAKAIEYGEKAVAEDPDFADAYYLLVEIYGRTKWTIREARSLEKFIATAENNSNIQISYNQLSESLYHLAYYKYSEGDLVSAIGHLEDSIAYNPNNVQARTYLMNIYYQVGQDSQALQQAEEIKRIRPRSQELNWLTSKAQRAATYGKEAFDSYEKGYHAYISKDYVEAIQLLEHAIRISSGFKDAYYYLALSYYHYGNLEEAIRNWEEAIQLDSFDNNARIYLNKAKEEKKYGRDVVWSFNQGYKHYISGEYEEALMVFKRVVNMNPDFEKARMYLMRTYYHLNQMDEYLEERKKIGESEAFTDDWGKEYYLLAYDFYSLGEYDIALENLKEALEVNSDYLAARFLIAETYFQLNYFEEAILHYQYIVDNFTESEYYDNALLGGGWCAYLLGDYQQSEEYLELLVKEFPKSSLYQEALYKLGRVYFRQEKYNDTIDVYEELRTLDSPEYNVLENQYLLGQSYFWVEDYTRAKTLLQDIIENHPNFDLIDETQYYYSFSLFKEEQYQEATVILENLAAKEDSQVREEASYLLGRSLLELKEYDRVIEINLSLLEQGINNSMVEGVLFDLGLSYARKGEDEEAISYFKRVMDEYPQGELAKISKIESAQSYYQLGQYQDTLEILENIDTKEALEIKIDSARKLGDENQLLTLYQELGEKYPDDDVTIEGYFSLATSQFDSGKFQEAIHTLQLMESMTKTAEIAKEIDYWQGLSFYRLGEYSQAKEYFQRIDYLAGDEIATRSLYMLGETCYQQEDYAQAVEYYQDFLQHYDSHSLAEHVHYNIAWSHLNNTDYANALSSFNLLIQRYPESQFLEESLFLMGKIQFLAANNNESRLKLKNFIKEYSESQYREEAIYLIAQIDLEEQQWIDSIIYFERLINEYPDSRYLPGSLYGLCLSYFQKEEYNKSLSVGERYLNSFAGGSFECDILYITAVSLEELGNKAEAREKYEQIISSCEGSTYIDSARKQLEFINPE
jgi:tetratricopeptide (TPR) repeat protein